MELRGETMGDTFNISEHFTLKEAWHTSHSDLLDENHRHCSENMDRVVDLARGPLELIRKEFGPVLVSSWVRCPALNERIGGAKNSQHLDGSAADIYLPAKDWGWSMAAEIVKVVIAGINPYGQVIREVNRRGLVWVHVSLPDRARDIKYQTLDQFNGRYYPFNADFKLVSPP